MLTDNKLLRIKNGVLLLIAVICPIVCRLISIPLPSVMTEWDKTSLYIRNMTGYLRDNYVSLVFFFVFVTSGLTSLLLGNLIHRKFDRNKEASVISLRAGLFFLIAAAFFLTDANTMFVLPGSRELSGYISCASLMLMPQLFIACVKLVYKRKWIILSEWIFLILEAAFFILGMLQAPQEYVTLTVRVLGFLFCFFVMSSALLHIRTLSGKFKNHIKEYNSKSNLKLDLAYGYARRENTDISTYELFNKADKEMYRFKRRGKALIKMNA